MTYCGMATKRLYAVVCVVLWCGVSASAAWTVTTMEPVGASTVSEETLNLISTSGKARIRFTSDTAEFRENIALTSNDFLKLFCSSNLGLQNPYGFEFFKDKFERTTVEVRMNPLDGSYNIIELVMNPIKGFTIIQSETISCVVDTRFVSAGILDNPVVSFPITASSRVFTKLLTRSNAPIRWAVLRNPAATVYTETTIRDGGLEVNVFINADAWNLSPLAPTGTKSSLQTIANFSCDSPGDDNACPFLNTFFRSATYFSINAIVDPQSIFFSVPRTLTRLFNTKSDVHVCLIVNASKQYGSKSVGLGADTIDTCFTIFANTVSMGSLYVALVLRGQSTFAENEKSFRRQSLVLTENCLRGRNTTNATNTSAEVLCADTLWLYIDDIKDQMFTMGAWTKIDFQEVAFYSTGTAYFLKLVSNIVLPPPTTSVNNNGLVSIDLIAQLYPHGDPAYQIDVPDVVVLRVPYSAMTTGEESRNVITILVLPSPGDIVGEFPAVVAQRTIWTGGQVLRLHMGGERWVPEILSNVSMLRDVVTGSRSAGDGWDAWKECAMPQGCLSFENTTTPDGSRFINQSVLVVTLRECPQYTVGGDETVSFNIPPTFGVSALGFASVASTSFVVLMSPTTFFMSSPSFAYTRDSFPFAVFRLIIQGGTSFKTGGVSEAACLASLQSSWTTNQPSDAQGWGNATVRSRLLRSASYEQDRYGTVNVMVLAFDSAFGEYATTKGEVISVGSLSTACVNSDAAVPPDKPYLISVTPRRPVLSGRLTRSVPGASGNANVTVMALNQNVTASASCTAEQVRTTNISIELNLVNDTFATNASVVVSSFLTNSPQPFGFAPLRSRLMPLSSVEFRNASSIVINWTPGLMQFAITSAEVVTIAVSRLWTASEQDAGFLVFQLTPSPGSIRIADWFGGDGRNVTESDVRAGRLWFRFAMLGDQWRQERGPFVNIFGGPTGEATGMLRLIDELVPSIEFFNFSSSDTFQYLTLTLQASDTYDISVNETVRISFSQDTTSSGLVPRLESGDAAFSFRVTPIAGRCVVSGRTQLTEKIFREGAARIFVSLYGESFVSTNTTQCIRNGISLSGARNAALNTTILPVSNIILTSPSSATLTFSADRTYALPANETDVLTIAVLSDCMRSKISAHPSEFRFVVSKTPGELSLRTEPQVITEAVIRNQSVTLYIIVDGNTWNRNLVRRVGNLSELYAEVPPIPDLDLYVDVLAVEELITSGDWMFSALEENVLVNASAVRTVLTQSLSSSASPLEETTGFATLLAEILPLPTSPLTQNVSFVVNSTTMTILLQPVAEYAIDAFETISILIFEPSLLADGVLPSPSLVRFDIDAVDQVLTLLYDPPGGQLSMASFQSSIASLLSLSGTPPPGKAGLVTATLADGRVGFSYVIDLVFSVTPSETDPRTTSEVIKYFLALDPLFLESQIGVRCAVRSGGFCNTSSRATASPASLATTDGGSLAMWVVIAVAVTAAVSGITYLSLVYSQTTLSGSHRKNRTRKEPVPYTEGEGPTEARWQRPPVSQLIQPPMSLREFVRQRNATAKDDDFFTEKDLEDLDDEPSQRTTLMSKQTAKSLEALEAEQRRQEALDKSLQRRGKPTTHKGIDLRADFQL